MADIYASSAHQGLQVLPTRAGTSYSTRNLYCIGLAIFLVCQQVHGQDAVSDPLSNAPRRSKVVHLSAFSDFQALFKQPQPAPSLVMACGFDRPDAPTKPCRRLAEMVSNITLEHPEAHLQLFYLNMSAQIDPEYLTHVRYQSDPQFLYIRDGRMYYYAKATVSNSQLLQFVQYFDENPDFMYRRLSDQPLGMVDNMLEGLYRILDKTQLIFGRYRAALYFVYCIFGCIGFMMVYAVYAIFDEAISGRRYAGLAARIKQAEATKQTPIATSEDLKVKKE